MGKRGNTMKLTKSRLRQLIQEELQAVLREQTEEDLSYLSGLESGMSPEELSLLSLGLDPNLAPLDPAKLPSAAMTDGWQEQVDANKAKKKAEIGRTEGWLEKDKEESGPSDKQVNRWKAREEMEQGSTRHGTRK